MFFDVFNAFKSFLLKLKSRMVFWPKNYDFSLESNFCDILIITLTRFKGIKTKLKTKLVTKLNSMNLLKLSFLLFLISFTTTAQDFSDIDKSPMDAVITRNQDNSPLARIIYSSPKKKGRKIFGKLVPFNKIWRTGANEATEITFYENVNFNGTKVEAGTYSLYTIPEEKQWTIIINKKINVWGAYSYDESLDLLRTTVPAKSTAAPVEDFSITFKPKSNGSDLLMGWDDTFVEIPIKKAD